MKKVSTGQIMMRQKMAEVLIEETKKGTNLVVLDADLVNSSGLGAFASIYPNRFYDCGIQEANMVGIAGGLSMTGYTPVIHTFASFAARRVVDQIFMAGIYNQQDIKIIGSDPGILNCANAGTHYALEDIGIMRSMNGITIVDPSDVTMLNTILPKILKQKGVCYIRLTRKTKQVIYSDDVNFEIGKAHVLSFGSDANIIASGTLMVPEAIKAAENLKREGLDVGVIDMFTINPIDKEVIKKVAKYSDIIVSAENHNVNGGLGSSIAEVIAEESLNVKFSRIAFREKFGEAGTVDYIKKKFNMSSYDIVSAVKRLRAEGERK